MREKYLEMPDKTGHNAFNIDKKFGYSAVRGMVLQSLEKIVREEINRRMGSINLQKIGIQRDEDDIVVANSGNPFDYHDDTAELSASAELTSCVVILCVLHYYIRMMLYYILRRSTVV
jgi:hypothetical protein